MHKNYLLILKSGYYLIATAQTTADGKGYVTSGTFRGTGAISSAYRSLTLPFQAYFLILSSPADTSAGYPTGYLAIFSRAGFGIGIPASPIYATTTYPYTVRWSGNTVQWRYYQDNADGALNFDKSGVTYYYVALK